ncbi:putative uncharacterized protein DDB_G0282133 [Lucilia cuprina]|uniref:putative uncharacterized protein DDB_G0282133 n=1 Tax=Lucilia cuprina TaxID=7375 RepID=UPI001F058754|nr:putative uncharacterized protein DDB_G0282133 [Lucilia cuprina]
MERVYVGNLPPDIRIKDIDDFFRAFGKLVYIDVNHRANPVYALVQFDSARNAFNAVKARHGYDYEGYTLQLRLIENEVRKRRDATPPPPPPPMLSSNFGSQNNRGGSYNNNSNNNNRMGGNFFNNSNSYQSSSNNAQWSNMSQGMQQQQNNRVNMPQQNMMDYQKNNRSNNMQQQNMMSFSFGNGGGRSNNMPQNTNNNRSNMQQQFSNTNRSNMQQQYSNTSNRSNMQQQQYSNSNRSNMQQQNMNNYSNMSQQNMMNYSNSNYSNFSQQQQQNMNMMDYSNNSSWNSGNNNNNNMMMNNMGWNAGNNMSGGNNINPPNNYNYNSNNDPYARPGFEDNFTHGLSGSGRKWFNRYIRKGFSPEIARAKALEHRAQPYPRDNVNNNNNNNAINPIPNDPTNVALETIGNTLLSLLSTTPADNFNNGNQMMNWGGDNFQPGFNNSNIGNFDMSGPSSSVGNMMSQSPIRGQLPRNRVSRQTYLRSLDILKRLRGKREQSAKDKLSKKYHTQIVKDYEQYEKVMRSSSAQTRAITTSSNPRNDRQIANKAAEGKSYTELSIALRKKKQQLFLAAKRLGIDTNKRFGGAYKKRIRILMNECGFEDLEAKALAVHPLEKLQPLMDLKAECDNALRKKQESFSVVKKISNKSSKIEAYRRDINFLKKHEKLKFESLSSRLKTAIRSCLIRIHKHEKEARKPLTKTKFIKLLPRKTEGQKTTTTSNTKKTAGPSKTKTTADTNTKKNVEKKDNASEDKPKPTNTEKPEESKKVNAETGGKNDKQEAAKKKEN